MAYLVAEPEHKPESKPNRIKCKCETYKIGDILTDGNIDFMILGINRNNDSVYLPYIGWCNYFRNFHKKEEQSKSFEEYIQDTYYKGFDFCQKSCGLKE